MIKSWKDKVSLFGLGGLPCNGEASAALEAKRLGLGLTWPHQVLESYYVLGVWHFFS